MKKIFTLFFCILLTTIFSTVVGAANIPVKDAWFTYGYGEVMVLCENGNLYIGDSINDDTPTLLLENVIEVVNDNDVHGYVEGGAALQNNGDISFFTVKDYSHTAEFTRTISPNALKLFNASSKACFFINSNNELIYYQYRNNYFNDYFVVTDDVDKVYTTPQNTSIVDLYIIKTNGDLYKYTLDISSTSNRNNVVEANDFILSSVKDVMVARLSGVGVGNDYVSLFLKNNGDLYFCNSQKNEPLERIGKSVKTLNENNVRVYNVGKQYCLIDYIDSNNILYVYNSLNKKIDKFYDKTQAVYHVKESRDIGRYIVSTDNKLFYCKSIFYSVPLEIKEIASNILGFVENVEEKYLVYSTDQKSIIDLTENKEIITDVKKVVTNNHLFNDVNHYMFIKTNGELWATQSMYGDEPFLTKFSEKPTKLYIYGFETYLVSEIQIKNDRSMYPFRECLENLGATVLWDSVNRCAIGEANGNTVEFPIDQSYYYINGELHYMDTTSYISEGRTYIPIRYAAEALGYTVKWESSPTENAIYIDLN